MLLYYIEKSTYGKIYKLYLLLDFIKLTKNTYFSYT